MVSLCGADRFAGLVHGHNAAMNLIVLLLIVLLVLAFVGGRGYYGRR